MFLPLQFLRDVWARLAILMKVLVLMCVFGVLEMWFGPATSFLASRGRLLEQAARVVVPMGGKGSRSARAGFHNGTCCTHELRTHGHFSERSYAHCFMYRYVCIRGVSIQFWV